LTFLFTDLHPIATLADAKDYVARLAQVKRQAEQVVDGLKRRQAAGVVLPRFYFGFVLANLGRVADGDPRETAFYTALESKLNILEGLPGADKQALLDAAEQEITESVQPGFRALIDTLEQQEQVANNSAGVWKFPGGADYYAYVLRTHTTTTLTADEIHALGLAEVTRLQKEIRAAGRELGYPPNIAIQALFERAARESGTVKDTEIVSTYQALIENAERDLAPAFNRRPRARVIVIGGPTGGYYYPPPLDGSRPGAFYAEAQGTKFKLSMPTTAYHEAVPGHHFQMALQQELELPLFRHDTTLAFSGYAEGWALYGEQLVWEMGFYKNDPYGNLGRLQGELYRAARLVVDTGINAKKWSYDRAVDYMLKTTGLPERAVQGEVARYICWPGQATSYKVGMLKILELRQRANARLGNRFDLKEFHDVIIGSGALPLEILERLVDNYIERKLE
jgi:uncharacterized protein (DUF885 family)